MQNDQRSDAKAKLGRILAPGGGLHHGAGRRNPRGVDDQRPHLGTAGRRQLASIDPVRRQHHTGDHHVLRDPDGRREHQAAGKVTSGYWHRSTLASGLRRQRGPLVGPIPEENDHRVHAAQLAAGGSQAAKVTITPPLPAGLAFTGAGDLWVASFWRQAPSPSTRPHSSRRAATRPRPSRSPRARRNTVGRANLAFDEFG